MSDSEVTGPTGSPNGFATQNGPNSSSNINGGTAHSPVAHGIGSQSGTAVEGQVKTNGIGATGQHHHPHVYPSMYKDTTYTKIFVGGLPYHTSDKTLREYFEVFGEIEEAVVITDRQTNKSRGYGFVTMMDRAAAERACKEPNPIIDGRKANVNLAYLGAKPRNNGLAASNLDGVLTALQARAAAAGFNPFLANTLGYHSPYLYPSPILISPNLFLPNGGHTSPTSAAPSNTTATNGQSPPNSNLSSSATSPPPGATGNGAQSNYYDFTAAAALAAAASFIHPQLSQAQYAAGFGDPMYNFNPYGNYIQMNGNQQTNGNSAAGANMNGGPQFHSSQMMPAQSLRGDK